ncbi:beta-ketoacyl synthase N-terminal-like domain-containing protein [Streptomyces hyaluromycini]|uniref:beta-ketoacyl synthase N-terminal-like domain-containing protein n=1 Tax=Streptomyces hyaluromycini TaxID=1377993 RepID=UPI00142E404C|nr:beta-ketoacyl synthase N-terminal-like domain-containing protein [Streptomyces hyaluromycini]
MAVEVKPGDYRALLSRSMQTIKRLTAELETKTRTREPIAVLGMGFRLPGGCSDPDTFWRFLRDGGDGVVEVPKDRWRLEDVYEPGSETPGKIYLKEAGFLREDVTRFDAHFFGISPREAIEMDPQQRLLLEVTWEALERAGISPEGIRGSQTGVFVGQIGSEYAGLPRSQPFGNPYTLTGSMSNITSGRISYVLGVHGPSISIDTACSSSLVSVHLACESLNSGESDLALAGGVNLLLASQGFSSLCDMGALSRDGRCKTFDADGDGYGRGEGCGVVVLKRLSDAVRDGDPVLAVIRGSGVNQDGPGSGLTVPNGSAQRALIRATLARAGVLPSEVGYFEAHGTGTALGDPIEFQAMTDVFGNDPLRKTPLQVGSVKSNIGHLEGAAGVAGLIKLVLCLQHREIPPNLHLNTLNPKIRLTDIPANVPQTCVPWEAEDRPRIAAISSFGFSGTNAHAILEEGPATLAGAVGGTPGHVAHSDTTRERPLHILALSAKSKGALHDLATAYERLLDADDTLALADICHTANVGRGHFPHRLCFVAADTRELKQRVSDAVRDGTAVNEGSAGRRQAPKLAALFNGRGDRRLAVRLFHSQPEFRAAAQACDEAVRKFTGTGFVEHWSAVPNGSASGAPIAAPQDRGSRDIESFALQFALSTMWQSWGVRPRAVLGRGTGELVAACAAGVMDMSTALGFLVAGTEFARTVPEAALRVPSLRVLTATTGGPLTKQEALSAAHWAGVASARARPDAGIDELMAQGHDGYLGIGAEATDDAMAARLVSSDRLHIPFPSSSDPWDVLAHALAELYEAGLDVDWKGFDRGYRSTRVVAVPTYPFQRKRYWIETAPTRPTVPVMAERDQDALDGRVLPSPLKETQVEFTLPMDTVPDVRATHGVLHAGYYLEMLARAVRQAFDRACTVRSLAFISALLLQEEGQNEITLVLQRREDEASFGFYCRTGALGNWSKHAQGTVELHEDEPVLGGTGSRPIAARAADLGERRPGSEFYAEVARTRRLELGEGVRWIADLWKGNGEALARLAPPPRVRTRRAFTIGAHPGVYDACAQLFHAALPDNVEADTRFMVTEWRDIGWHAADGPRELWCHATVERYNPNSGELHGRFELLDQDGTVVGRIEGGTMKGLGARHDQMFQQLSEQPSHASASDEDLSVVMLSLSDAAAADRLRVLEDYLRGCFADLMKMDQDELDVEEPLADLGMDSLVGVSAKKTLDTELRIQLPLALLIEGPSVRDLARTVLPMVQIVEHPRERNADGADGARTASASAGRIARSTRWIALRKPNPSAKFKLFCFPYGRGRGASVFREWQRLLPDEVEVCPVQLPGKESRIKERAFEDIDTAIDTLAESLAPELDRPYALYGHSAGGLLAYRLAYRLWQTHENRPHHLFVGAYSAPPVQPNPMIVLTRNLFKEIGFDDIPAPDDLLSATAVEKQKILQVLTSEADLSGELAELLLPSRLAELKMVQSFQYEGARFDVPVTAFHGLRDDRVDQAHMTAWREVTDGAFTLHLLSGDHLFLSEDQDQLLLLHHIQRGLGVD